MAIDKIPAEKARENAEMSTRLGLVRDASLELSKHSCIGPLETHTDAEDRLSGRLSQLHTMLHAAYGGHASDGFTELGQRGRDNYLWACADMVSALRVDAQVALEQAYARGRRDALKQTG